MHITLLVLLPTFAWLTWWQLGRALGGNTLSWAYTFEWPLFAGYACYVWWQLIHDAPTAFQRVRSRSGDEPRGLQDEVGWALNDKHDVRAKRLERIGMENAATAPVGAVSGADAFPPAGPGAATPGATCPVDGEDLDDEDPELAEYNRYLAELNAGPDPRKW
jgi:hypothetical protein